MNNVIAFPRLGPGGRLEAVPFAAVASRARWLLAQAPDLCVQCVLEFREPGHVTIVLGWPDPDLWAMPFDMGFMPGLAEYLERYERAVDDGREPVACLVSFHSTREECEAFWAFSSTEAVKFSLK